MGFKGMTNGLRPSGKRQEEKAERRKAIGELLEGDGTKALDSFKKARKTELREIFEALLALNLGEFLQGCLQGFGRELNDGEQWLVIVMKEQGLKKVEIREPEDFNTKRYRKGLETKENLLSWLEMIQEAARKHPGFWEEYDGQGFSKLLVDVAGEYATLVQLLNKLKMHEAEGRMLHIYETDYAVWCCVEDRLEKDRGLRPDYSKTKVKRPSSGSSGSS